MKFCKVCGRGPIPNNRYICESELCAITWRSKGYDEMKAAGKI